MEFGDLQPEGQPLYGDFTGTLYIYQRELGKRTAREAGNLAQQLGTVLICVGIVNIEEEVYSAADGSVILGAFEMTYYAGSFVEFLERFLGGRPPAPAPPRYSPGIWSRKSD